MTPRSLPPFPHDAADLRIAPVLTLGADTPAVSPDAWMIAASFALPGGHGDPARLAPDTTELPVVTDGTLYKVTLGDLLHPDAHGGDVADVLRATIAAAAAHALAMRRLAAAAERLLSAPAVTPNGAPR